MNPTPRRERFRSILDGDRCVYAASVFDPISARIAEDLGFEVGMLAGSVASATVLGAPDLVVLTLTELAQQLHRICRAGELPLLVDADHGYGNALNVMRTVEELENAGTAGLTIEDTLLPRGFGDGGARRMVPLEEGVGKMKAAVAARRDPALVIAARTSALRFSGVQETVRRARAYRETGVDALFLAGARSREEVAAVRAEVNLPLVLGGASEELLDPDFLAANGVRIALQGHQPFRAAVKAVYDALQALKEGVDPNELASRLAPADLMAQVTRSGDYSRWEDEFLG